MTIDSASERAIAGNLNRQLFSRFVGRPILGGIVKIRQSGGHCVSRNLGEIKRACASVTARNDGASERITQPRQLRAAALAEISRILVQ